MTVEAILAHALEHLEIAQDEHRAASDAAHQCWLDWARAADLTPDAQPHTSFREAYVAAAALRDDRAVSLHSAAVRVAGLQIRAAA